MKKICMLLLALLPITIFALPNKDSFTLNLTKVYQGKCDKALVGTPLDMSYEFDFERNMGLAKLDAVDETPVNIDLNPLGVASRYMFMSDIKPSPVTVNGQETYLYRIIFDLSKEGEKAAMIMFGEDGDCILSTDNYDRD